MLLGPHNIYRRLLRGEVTPERYVAVLKRAVDMKLGARKQEVLLSPSVPVGSEARPGTALDTHHWLYKAGYEQGRADEHREIVELKSAANDVMSWLENTGFWTDDDVDYIATVKRLRAALLMEATK